MVYQMGEEYLLVIVGSLLAITALVIVVSNNILHCIIYSSIFSLLCALYYLLTAAPDVAMTETALSVCLSTAILLNFLKACDIKPYHKQSKSKIYINICTLILCISLFCILSWVIKDLSPFGSASTPLINGASRYYVKNTLTDIGMKEFVAAVLASYRGFDTLGETSVILIAGLGFIIILKKAQNAKK